MPDHQAPDSAGSLCDELFCLLSRWVTVENLDLLQAQAKGAACPVFLYTFTHS